MRKHEIPGSKPASVCPYEREGVSTVKALFWLAGGTLVLLVALPVWAQPSLAGRWVVTEGDEDIEGILEMWDTGGWLLNGNHFNPVTVEAGSVHPEYLLRVEGEEAPFHFVVSGEGEAFLFNERDDELLRAYRVSELPPELAGEWELSEPRSSRGASRLLAGPSGAIVIGPSGVELGALEMVSVDGRPALALLEGGRGVDGEVYRLVALAETAYALVEVGDDDLKVLYRPGAAPELLGPLPEFASESVCELAARKYQDCLIAICDDGDHPACSALGSEMPDFECTPEIAEVAAEVLEQPCEELIPPLPPAQ